MDAPRQKTEEKVAEDSGARQTLCEQSVPLAPHAPQTPGLHSRVPSGRASLSAVEVSQPFWATSLPGSLPFPGV